MSIETMSCFFLILFTIVATVDGLYFHLYKYRLYEKPESQKEHALHTWNSFLFPFTVFFLFAENFSGIFLWIAVILTFVTLIIEFCDVFEEKKSRQALGGLTSLEYSMHFGMAGLRAVFTTLILANKPWFAWSFTGPLLLYNYSNYVRFIGYSIAFVGIPIFILHFMLMLKTKKNILKSIPS
ncbi:hypothetical protein [Fluviispira multicolorata]|uniref:Uncharacterized protein n=1 Tax=Fluviispira multicolorata TaxID=2654512 RepID=A0A833N6F2_9BACT|nr:hypothetical protein [Fluviispira multicolorata]KAB8033370.1 hypothetical protein GCL57_01330 [Fluviispira multicolorata]